VDSHVDRKGIDATPTNFLGTGVCRVVRISRFGLAASTGPVWTVLLTGFLVWQLYHYQRQNYGLIALAAQSTGAGKMSSELNGMLNLGVAGAAMPYNAI